MGHNHVHNHTHSHEKAFAVGIILNIIFVAIEVFYGFIANSSALLADAGHNAGDVLSLVFAWFAIWLAAKKPKGKFTYGFKKTTILISVLNAVMLFIAIAFITRDAIGKLKNPVSVAGDKVMIVAGIGVVINTITALLFLKGQKHDLNIKGAFLHMAADAGVSLGVVISGLLILKTGIRWIDPIMSFLIIIVILYGTWKLFTESIRLALDVVPENINIEDVKNELLNIEGIIDIHDLHLWAMSTTENSLSAHVVAPVDNPDKLLLEIKTVLLNKFNIDHITIQVEKNDLSIKCEEC
ncbi:MAG: cation transporter [Prolixibacteraceae bacterium]|nr:cation transporter [Prolixibacteraceae bacterium]MBN2775095.1 cation transporter [Prolixibacteraceae bacterium]